MVRGVTDDCYACAFAREGERRRAANAGTTTGDECGLAAESLSVPHDGADLSDARCRD
jgi:hypothetical protein